MKSGPVLIMTGIDCERDKEKGFNEWDSANLPPAVKQIPGIIRIDRYERVDDDKTAPRFLSIMQFEDAEAVDNMVNIDAISSLGKIYFEEASNYDIRFYWSARYKSMFTAEK